MPLKRGHPFEHALSLIRNPLTFSGTPIKEYRAPPRLGENTNEVLSSRLGYDEAKIEGLKAQGVVWARADARLSALVIQVALAM